MTDPTVGWRGTGHSVPSAPGSKTGVTASMREAVADRDDAYSFAVEDVLVPF